MTQYNTGNAVPSSDMPDAWDNNATIDIFVNSPDLSVTTRTGIERDTMAGIQQKSADQREQIATDGAAVVEETRQNLIPLSRQYMTLAEAQADIANIPEGSTTYVRSSDDAYLAIEYKNTGGVLQPTGRTMISGKTAVRRTDEYSDGVNYAWGKVMSSGEILPGTLQGMDGLPAPENVAAYAAKGVAVYQLNPADIPAGHAIIKDGIVLLEADQSSRAAVGESTP